MGRLRTEQADKVRLDKDKLSDLAPRLESAVVRRAKKTDAYYVCLETEEKENGFSDSYHINDVSLDEVVQIRTQLREAGYLWRFSDHTQGKLPIEWFPPHEAAQLIPEMAEAELNELAEDIKRAGQRVPIIIYQGKVLDGRHRQEACKRLGIEPEAEFYGDEELKRAGGPVNFVASMNTHRRHLTVEQKRDVIARILKENPSQSDRQVAKKVGADHKTVAKERGKLEGSGEIPQMEKRTDAKGVKRPGKKPSAKKASSVKPEAKQVAADKPAARESEEKPKEPETSAIPAATAIDNILRLLHQAQREINAMAKLSGSELVVSKYLQLKCETRDGEQVERRYSMDIANAISELEHWKPVDSCPQCKSKVANGCQLCLGTGFVTKAAVERCPDRLKSAS